MNIKTFFLVVNLLISFEYYNSQNEFSKWYFGQYAGLDFATNPPTILTNGNLNAGEGVATISDNSGNLLFYTDGTVIFNSNHSIMANGNGLFGHQSTTQSALIVKQPGSNNLFWVFTLDQICGNNGARYSIVDMSLAAGLGSVTVKNATLYSPSCEKQVAVRHCNGRDIWLLSHECNTNNFRSYLLTSNGISSNYVISSVGETLSGNYVPLGQMKISPDGKKLAVATASNSTPSSNGMGGFQIFDFDASSGQVSNFLSLNSISFAYGIEFSSDGTKLYGVTSPGPASITATMFQWNICAGSPSLIVSSQYTFNLGNMISGSLQRAIDGKIYLAENGPQSLNVINNPNSLGSSINFVLGGQSISPKYGRLGLPNFINSYTKPIPAPFTSSLSCQSASFTVPPIPSFSSGCSSTPYAPSGYLWDFGEGSSGAANNSTLTNPSHTYANAGTYTVSLILFNNCTNDTLKQIVNVSTPGPNPQVAGTFTICKGDKQTYTVSGGSSYLWFNNVSTNTISLSPNTNTVYSVRSSSNGCNVSKSFSVTVNPCLGISQNANTIDFRVFPNPVNDILTVSTDVSGTLSIYDNTGRLIHCSHAESGQNLINTKDLSPGIYIVELKNEQLKCYGRIFKI